MKKLFYIGIAILAMSCTKADKSDVAKNDTKSETTESQTKKEPIMVTGEETITLPTAEKTGGKAIMDVFNERKSIKEYSGKGIDIQNLSNLLWAANGFNREDKRTVPTAQNKQELDLYVIFKEAAYLYDAKVHKLTLVAKGDFRKSLLNDRQTYVNDAAVNLVLVADLEKAAAESAANIDCGYISQNIYLYCASANLGTVARVSIDAEALKKDLNLKEKQVALLSHSVGIPNKSR